MTGKNQTRLIHRNVLLLAASLTLAGCGSSAPLDVSGASSQTTAETVGVTTGPLISGTVSWVSGTHAWTDYAYDDRGRTAAATYPDDIYPNAASNNAADLIQLQLRLDDDHLRIRAVLETLVDPALPLLGVGLDLDGDPQTGAANLPGGGWQVKGAPLGLERLIVVSADGTRVMSWQDGGWSESAGSPAMLDAAENTIDVAIPRTSLDTGSGIWRAVGVLGLASPGQSWLTDGGPILDLAYVRDVSVANWQSGLQAAILNGEADAAQAVVTLDVADFSQLRTTLAQPQPGLKETFLYRSKLKLGEGIRDADRKYAGPYQPYAAWFPPGLPPTPPLIVYLHGAMQDHLSGPYGDDASLLGDLDVAPIMIGTGNIDPAAVIVTPLGRAEVFGWYSGAAEQDVLDVADDAQRRFGVDPNRVVLTGYSLGGVGTFNLAQLYPDRWAGAIDIVGAPDLGIVELLGLAPPLPYTLENLRNLPFRLAHSRADELEIIVGVVQPDLAALQLHQLGYDYRYWQFYLRDHLNFPVPVVQCEYEAAIARGRVVDPARVIYSQEPALRHDDAETGLFLPHDSAYWMSGMVVRGQSFSPGEKGTVDITSLALPDRVPQLQNIAGTAENISAGRDVCGDNPAVRTNDIWTVLGQAWTGYEPQPISNGMRVELTSVAAVTLDVARMRLDPGENLQIDISSDGDSVLKLRGDWPDAVMVMRDEDVSGVSCARDGVLEIAAGTGNSNIILAPAGARQSDCTNGK